MCKSCMVNLNNTECPTCRRPMQPGHVNYPLAGLIDKVRHFCKNRHLGCDTKAFLVDLSKHEKKCAYNKTIKCPHWRCRQDVILSDFYDHAVNSACCSIFEPGTILRVHFTLPVRSSKDKTFSGQKDKNWTLVCLAEKFYVHIQYLKKSEVMVIYVATGPTENYYQAEMKIVDDNNPHQEISITRDVIPLDEVPKSSFNRREAIMAEKRCWFVPKCSLDSLINVQNYDGVSRMFVKVLVNII